MNSSPILTLDSVSKKFGRVTVLNQVTLHVRAGHVQALLGENGAGKSTLIKIMAGIHQPDGGRVIMDGEPVTLSGVKSSEARGIATIHQELNLVPTMTVAENIVMGRFPSRMGFIRRREIRRVARQALDLIGLDIDVNLPVGTLGVARQQLIEIAKALSLNARVLILDEPTAALTDDEVERLFSVIQDLRMRGVGMVFISHHLDEISRIADDVTVLRDGEFVDDVPAHTEEDTLVHLMVGRNIDDQYPRSRATIGKTLLEVSNLSREGLLDRISLNVRAGEVVGIAGLVGAGRTELIRAIAGVDRYDGGTVSVEGNLLPREKIGRAIRAGVGHVPEDRKVQGLVLEASVNDNIGYATLSSTAKGGIVDIAGQRRRAAEVASSLRIRMESPNQLVQTLSGGNQQKVVFGRWILANSKVLLLDEPTRGVDVGARIEIYQFINRVTAAGGAVLMVSSDLPEVLGMSDRILVMSGGHIAGELDATKATQDQVMTLAVRDVARDQEDFTEGLVP